MGILEGPFLVPKGNLSPDSIVILLHGRGSNGRDLFGFADLWAETFPSTAFYAPNAPHQFEGGFFGYQWYTSRSPEERLEGLISVTKVLNKYVDEVLNFHQVSSVRCVLVGFSQGSMLSLHLAPRRLNPLGGVVAFSGAMMTLNTLKDEIINEAPICLITGQVDSVIPPERSQEASLLLTELGVPNELHILDNLGHSIDGRGLEIAKKFIFGLLGPTANNT